MRIAFSKPTPEPEEQRELFDNYRTMGYDGLQLKRGQYLSYVGDPETFRETWGDQPGSTSALIVMGNLQPAGLASLRDIVDFGVAVGSERVVFCHNISRKGLGDSDIAGYARTLSEVGTEAADVGVALSLHHHYDQPVMHRHDFDVFFGAVQNNSVGLTVDTGHLAKSGIPDIPGLITDLRSVIDNIHLKDYKAGQWHMLGQGSLDFPAIFTALEKSDYDGWICADEESPAGITKGMEVSAAFLRSRLNLR